MIDLETPVVIELKWFDRHLGTIRTNVAVVLTFAIGVGGIIASILAARLT